jgi:hypothetical protein
VLDGPIGKVFVYQFSIAGSQVRGISVDGAHHLANFYGGIQHRIVGSMEKKGRMLTFTTYPAPGMPMQVSVSIVPELEHEDDFYRAVVEVKDIKTGNSFQAEKSETRLEKRRDGTTFERPNYSTIAQSKARRNAMLMVIPRDVQEKFEQACIDRGQTKDITEDVFAEKRSAVMQFAAKHGLAVDRAAINKLGNDQIAGLRAAMQEGGVPAFSRALAAIGLAATQGETVEHDEDGVVDEGNSASNGQAQVTDQGGQTAETTKTEERRKEPVQQQGSRPTFGRRRTS